MAPSTTRANRMSKISAHDAKRQKLIQELGKAILEVIEEIELSKEDVTA